MTQEGAKTGKMTTSEVMLVYPKLEKDNFSHWKFRVKLILEQKKLSEVLSKTIDELKTAKVESKDIEARNVIVHSLPDKFLDYVKNAETAADMIRLLEDIFERKSIVNKLHLRRKLINLRCKTNLQEHFLIFDKLVTELEVTGTKLETIDKICYLLCSLPEEYEQVVTSIETMSVTATDMKLDFVKARLLDAEIKLQDKNTEGVQENAFWSNCYTCNKPGHLARDCPSKSATNSYKGNTRGNRHRGRGYSQNYNRGRGESNNYNRQRGNQRGNYGSHNHNAQTTNEENSQYDSAFVTTQMALNANREGYIKLVIDSGCTQHIVQEKYEKYMTDITYLETPAKINVANGDWVIAEKTGNLVTFFKGNKITLLNALIVKGISLNLVSVKSIVEKGFAVHFEKDKVQIYKDGTNLFHEAGIEGKLYVMNAEIRHKEEQCNTIKNCDDVWHKRLGHLNRKSLGILHLPYSLKCCDECQKGKATRVPFTPTIKPRSRALAELLHTDIAGPMKNETYNGERYFQTIIDDYSHFCVVYLLKNKSEATENLIKFIQLIEKQTNFEVKRIRSDNGKEFTANRIKHFCEEKGIIQELTIPYSPQSNGVSERMNRTLLNKARTLMLESQLPKHLWGEAVKCATYQLNRCPSSAIDYWTPTEVMYGHKDLEKLRVFGSKAWAYILPKGNKLEPRAREMRLVGYGKVGYRLWDPIENIIKLSRDVKFDENDVKYIEKPEREEYYLQNQRNANRNYSDTEERELHEQEEYGGQKERQEEPRIIPQREEQHERQEEPRIRPQREEEETPTSRYGRQVKRPSYLESYTYETVYCLCTGDDPKTYEEAAKDEYWNEAINKELTALEKLKTWEQAILPENTKAISTKWIFKTKSDGTKKARLVAKGYQEENNDNVYSPVARASTIRLMLSQAVNTNLNVKQLDVPTAFLNGVLETDVYIKPPKGTKVEKGKVLKLRKSLYGLKEAPKCWNTRFHKFITSLGMEQSKSDFCLYKNRDTWLLVFVDDILLMGNYEPILNALKKEFNVKDLGNLKSYLGLEIVETKDGLEIGQSKMINMILERFQMKNCKGANTPMENNFTVDETYPVVSNVPYRELIGCLLYLASTSRPDISFATSFLSRYLDKPTEQLWTAAKRILRYLKNTLDKKMCYEKGGRSEIYAYSDSDWAGDKQDRKSVSGGAIFHGCNLISWYSKKQGCVALSTAEAEYLASAMIGAEVLYLRGVVHDFTSCYPTSYLLMDNQSAIAMIQSFENSRRSKHIDIKAHFIKDLVNLKILQVSYVPTSDNVADIMTKALCAPKHHHFLDIMKLEGGC